MLRPKLAQPFQGKISCATRSPNPAGEAFRLPRAGQYRQFSIHGRRRGTVSVIAVSGANRSLVIFRQAVR
jgi:hypothetical protein